MNRYFTILFITVCCFISCETVVTLDVPYEDTKLVVNSFFNPDSTFKISLYQSRFVLEEGDFKTVSGANVILYDEEGSKLAKLKDMGSGIYEAAIKPEIGKEYTVKVSKEGFEAVAATDRIPADSARITKYETHAGEGNDITLSIWLDDSPGKDFYELYGVEKSIIYSEEDTLVYENTMYAGSTDPIFKDLEGANTFLFFDDLLFNGKEEKITFSMSRRITCVDRCTEEEEITFFIRKVSESYFKYKKSRALQRRVGDNPFTEPAPVYTNIKNGFGIFAGFRTNGFVLETP